MAMSAESDSDHPYAGIVGTAESPTWADAAVAYATFYHLIGKGAHLSDAVQAMCVASGDRTFFCSTAIEIKKGYLEYLQTLNSVQVQSRLSEAAKVAQQQGSEELAKASSFERRGGA